MKRLIKKSDRLAVQQYEFERCIKDGYDQETYKGLNIFTQDIDGKYRLKVFKNTASKPLEYCYYRNVEQRTRVISNYKNNFDRSEAYKAECKANPTKSTSANCAAAIREELKIAFPGIKFGVTSSNFSMGNSVSIKWMDGPTHEQVTDITSKYQYGHFDGMNDIYENSNTRDDIPQSKYVSESRSMSPETKAILGPIATELWRDDENRGVGGNNLYRIFQKSAIPTGAKVTGIERTEKTCGLTEDLYFIAYELPADSSKPVFEKQEVKTGEINIIDYSPKSIAVIGDTKPIKDKLGKGGLNGLFSFKLSCGPGWIFPKTRLTEVQNFLNSLSNV
jgi:hypothetical protein